MRIGCCISGMGQLAALERSGADYCELAVASALMRGDEIFEAWAARLTGSSVPARACNVFLPGDLKVTGPDVDEARFRAYAETAMARMGRLGIEVLVFGSGTARSAPEGWEHERALEQYANALRVAASLGADHGVTVVLEPLRPEETNILNRVDESAAFIRSRDVAPGRLLADLYHMREQGEDLAVLGEVVDLLGHVHVAGVGRMAPAPDATDLPPFLHNLRDAGYGKACSIECSWKDFDAEAGPALALVRDLASQE